MFALQPKKSPTNALVAMLRAYVNFRGRATRSEVWKALGLYALVKLPLILLLLLIDLVFKVKVSDPIFFVFYGWIFYLPDVPMLAVLVRRLHDIGRSGWVIFWTALQLIVTSLLLLSVIHYDDGWLSLSTTQFALLSSQREIVNLVKRLTIGSYISAGLYWVYFLLANSDYGPNRYGLNPKGLGNDPDTIKKVGLVCAACGGLIELRGYRIWQWVVAVFFFPFGIFSFLAGRKPAKCSDCGEISAVKL